MNQAIDMGIRWPDWWAITQKKICEVLLRWAFISPIHKWCWYQVGLLFSNAHEMLMFSWVCFVCISNLRCGCELWALNIHSMIVEFCWKKIFLFQNLTMELVLLIYSELNSCIFLFMKEVIFFCYILKGALFCQNPKKNLNCWITITWAFMCFCFWKQSSDCCIILLVVKAGQIFVVFYS
jgi:hypothetical protein